MESLKGKEPGCGLGDTAENGAREETGPDRDGEKGIRCKSGAAERHIDFEGCCTMRRDTAYGNDAQGTHAREKRGLRMRIRNLPLRSFFLLTVFAVFGGVMLLSGLTIWGCSAFRRYLLPDPDAAYLTVQEVLPDGTVTEMTTWMNFGEATELPRLQVEETWAGTAGTEQTGAAEPEPEATGQIYAAAPDTETPGLVIDAAPGSAGKEPAQSDLSESLQPDSGEIDIDWQSDRYTTRTEDHGETVDTTYSIQKIEKSFDTLTPKRRLAYRFCGAAMVAVPAVLSIGGILFAGFFFYKKRLEKPLAILSEATGQIAAQNLDFSIEYPCGDEMGRLCESFERMRGELAQNNKSMWRLLDQRRLMQASIAHDLRNPIAIIQGYAEYLQIHLPACDLSPEKTVRIASNLKSAAVRLEQYTESVRVLNRLEEMEPDRSAVEAEALMEEVRYDLKMMADRAGVALHMKEVHSMEKEFSMEEKLSTKERLSTDEKHSLEGNRSTGEKNSTEKPLTGSCLMLDKAMFFRILENIFENAARFARSEVSVEFQRNGRGLTVTVADDGAGFPEEILKTCRKAILPTRQGDDHLGMGLAISRVLCEKHGGSLRLGNRVPHGAVVKIFLAV